MALFKEIPPTAGFPILAKDIFSSSPGNTKYSLEDDFKNYLDVPYAKVANSGTTSLYIILESLKKISPKKSVIIPSFICPLVPLAIKRAGLNVIVCDINNADFNFNVLGLEEVCAKENDILAIIPTHLGGIPIDLGRINQLAKKYKIFVIEDCAQSLGAEYKGKKIGAFGDFAFFSLCRGKGLTIYEGGVIIAKDKGSATLLDNTILEIEKNDFFAESLKIFELLGYCLIYKPKIFWFAYRLPQIFWESKGNRLKALGDYYTIDFEIHKVSDFRKAIGHRQFYRLDNEIKSQREKAALYIAALAGIKGVKIITEPADSKATYPYLTLILDSPQKKKAVLQRFENSGLGVFQIYDAAITDFEYLQDIVGNKPCPNARSLAQNHITLSTSKYLTEKDIETIVEIIKNFNTSS
ncbi:MAG: DegT/DnrJ/EryC1/StrS family aminotransferase [Candidatus Omnitrophica bacterium]|nr:DegT/DnrJ/EryC1/StrS family aminotransferase [Candidatus Omnitrophota bacterium]MBU1869500.1 DegT/DnrJ/EryC1/StrS family aminotransferase [Candidatus Omnitrophota bacterium]